MTVEETALIDKLLHCLLCGHPLMLISNNGYCLTCKPTKPSALEYAD